MLVTFWKMLKSLKERDTADVYDGYTPSKDRSEQKKNRTFDVAVQTAPIRDEWIAENPVIFYWHLLKSISGREWFEYLSFLGILVVMLFVLSL